METTADLRSRVVALEQVIPRVSALEQWQRSKDIAEAAREAQWSDDRSLQRTLFQLGDEDWRDSQNAQIPMSHIHRRRHSRPCNVRPEWWA